jgi:hypothetical protein
MGGGVKATLPPLSTPREGMPPRRWGRSTKRTGAACGFHTASVVETPREGITPPPRRCCWVLAAPFSTLHERAGRGRVERGSEASSPLVTVLAGTTTNTSSSSPCRSSPPRIPSLCLLIPPTAPLPPAGTFSSDVALVVIVVRRVGGDGRWPAMTWLSRGGR